MGRGGFKYNLALFISKQKGFLVYSLGVTFLTLFIYLIFYNPYFKYSTNIDGNEVQFERVESPEIYKEMTGIHGQSEMSFGKYTDLVFEYGNRDSYKSKESIISDISLIIEERKDKVLMNATSFSFGVGFLFLIVLNLLYFLISLNKWTKKTIQNQ